MAYSAFVVPTFKGMNLVSDPQEVGAEGTVEAKNVMFDAEGRVRTRPGYSSYSTMGGGELPERLFAWPRISTSQYLASSGGRLEAFASGSAVANVATSVSAAFAHDFAAFGSPTVEYVYTVGRGDASRRWDGSTFTTPAGIPDDAGCCTVQPSDNRLVLGASIDRSKVHFSDAGDPETFGANNYVYLTPGDGEEVVALCTFNNLVFAFKQTKFFVFYGTGTDGTGEPIFNYRTVDTGIGVSDFWPGAATTGPDGVYFRGTDGIYRTTGGQPELVSAEIAPVFKAQFQATSFLLGGASVPIPVESTGNGHTELRFVSSRHLAVSTLSTSGSAGVTFLWDRPTRSWAYWDTHAAGTVTAICEPLPSDTGTSMLFSKGTASIFKMRPVDTTDNAAAIAAHVLSGVYEVGTPGQDAYTRYTRLWGSGAPTVSVFTDMGAADANAAAVTLGTAPAVAQGYHSKSYKGQLFQHKISSTAGAWSLNRLQHDLAWVHP